MTREKQLALIWRHTHKDFRGMIGMEKAVLVLREGGTTSVVLTALTEDEVARKLRLAEAAEQRARIARVAERALADQQLEADDMADA